jgi:hypothetical protein
LMQAKDAHRSAAGAEVGGFPSERALEVSDEVFRRRSLR